jgi:hypothetical protein
MARRTLSACPKEKPASPIGCDLWQGTEKAHINGYSGELDANISYIG